MKFLSWFSIVALLILLGTYVYWSWREEHASPNWVRNSFYGGIIFFTALFFIFTWHTLTTVPERTHAEALVPKVVAGKRVWHKYVCINCHTLLGNGAYYGPDLTKTWNRFVERVGGDEKIAHTAMVTYLKNPPQPTAKRRGMPNLSISDDEAQQLVAFLQWVSRIDTNGWPPEPMRPISRAAPPKVKPTSPLVEHGAQLLSERGCGICHSTGGGPAVGPDLSGAAAKYDREALVRWIQDPQALYRERGQKPLNPGYPEMPNLSVSRQDAEAIAAYLLSLGGKE